MQEEEASRLVPDLVLDPQPHHRPPPPGGPHPPLQQGKPHRHQVDDSCTMP